MCVCVFLCGCGCVCVIISLCGWGYFLCTFIQYMGFMGYFLCLVGCFSMVTWTPTVLSVLYACVSYFCI